MPRFAAVLGLAVLTACASGPVYLPPADESLKVDLRDRPWQGPANLAEQGPAIAEATGAELLDAGDEHIRLRWRSQDPAQIAAWIDCGELHKAHLLDFRIDRGSDGPYSHFFTQGEGAFLDLTLQLELRSEQTLSMGLHYHFANPWFEGWRFASDEQAMARVPNRIHGSGRMRSCRSRGALEDALSTLIDTRGPVTADSLPGLFQAVGLDGREREAARPTMTLAEAEQMRVWVANGCGDREIGLHLYPNGQFELTVDQWTQDDRLNTVKEWIGQWQQSAEHPEKVQLKLSDDQLLIYQIEKQAGIWGGSVLKPLSTPDLLACPLSERQGIRG